MKCRLWRAGEYLGEADLSVVKGVSLRRAALSGPFLPTAAFSAVWPLFDEYHRLSAQLVIAVQSLAPAITPAEMPAALSAALPDGALTSMSRAQGAIAALGLQLRDGQDGILSGADVQVSTWRLFDAASIGEDARSAAEDEAERQGIPTAGYVMIVTGVRDDADGTPDPRPGTVTRPI